METERFTDFMKRANGIIFPYTTTADTVFMGSFSQIIRVSVIIAGVDHSSLTPWTV